MRAGNALSSNGMQNAGQSSKRYSKVGLATWPTVCHPAGTISHTDGATRADSTQRSGITAICSGVPTVSDGSLRGAGNQSNSGPFKSDGPCIWS